MKERERREQMNNNENSMAHQPELKLLLGYLQGSANNNCREDKHTKESQDYTLIPHDNLLLGR